nr:site-specific integrase [Cryobacterium sp. N21]
MAGRPRLPISTFGAIKTTEVGAGRFRAMARFRDWDGQSRQVTATGSSRNAAETALKVELATRMRVGNVGNVGDSANARSPFRMLAEAWLEDLMLDVDRANGTKTVYEYELRGLVLPFFEHFTVREVTVGRIELFLKVQRAISYARAKHSRTILSMVLGFAVRRGIIARNPVKETSRMKKPQHTPKALTPDQVAAIRLAARDWRTAEGRMGPKPDGQVRDLIEVMLGPATRIGETLALRKCDIDMTADPPWAHIRGTLVVQSGAGVLRRQAHPKTHESNRVVAVPQFAAEVIDTRMTMFAVVPVVEFGAE